MKTKVSSASREVVIAADQPTVLIGERINPSGRKRLSAALQVGDLEVVREEAIAQVQAGADILDVNVGVGGMDQVVLLPRAIQVVMETVDVPLCLDSDNPKILEAALKVYRGKPIVNSITGQADSLTRILPLVREYGAAVVGLTMDDEGIPMDPDRRVAIASRILERSQALGIAQEDVIIDCLAMTAATDSRAGLVGLQSVQKVKAELGVNQTLGVEAISYGLPDRTLLNATFLALAIAAGVTCPIVDVAKMRPTVLATDLLLGHDAYAGRYIKAYRQRQQALSLATQPRGHEATGSNLLPVRQTRVPPEEVRPCCPK